MFWERFNCTEADREEASIYRMPLIFTNEDINTHFYAIDSIILECIHSGHTSIC